MGKGRPLIRITVMQIRIKRDVSTRRFNRMDPLRSNGFTEFRNYLITVYALIWAISRDGHVTHITGFSNVPCLLSFGILNNEFYKPMDHGNSFTASTQTKEPYIQYLLVVTENELLKQWKFKNSLIRREKILLEPVRTLYWDGFPNWCFEPSLWLADALEASFRLA